MTRKKFHELAQHLQEVMEESLPKMMIADVIQQERENLRAEINNAISNRIPSQVGSSVSNYMSGHVLHDDLPICLTLTYKFERLYVSDTSYRPSAVLLRDQDDPNEDAHPEGENSAKRKKTSEHGTYVFGESSSSQDNESEPSPSTSGNQEQLYDFDFWTDSYGTDDDELPTEKVSQELVEEMSQIVDEAKLRKVKRNLSLTTSIKAHSSRLKLPKRSQSSCTISCQTDLLYLKKGNSGPEKIVMSLHKFPAVIFLDDDIEERTSKWVDKCVKKFNPYARYSVEHWKNPHAKIFYIKKQKEPEKPKEVNLNKNDIEDLYLLIVNGKVDDYAETGLMWSLSVFIRSIEKYKVFSIVSEPVYGIIYKNNKKEKRVMRHQEVHKFCDATLKRVLEGLKSYNNNVKHGYVTLSLSKEDVEYLQLFEEEIEERLKHRDQMRRWEMYVNGRPLGSRRERPE
ncbi:hypothetical protein Tco_0571174 [Tanacetum coccineum]